MSLKKIFWIASYPKSGNTWMRSIISSLFFSNNGKFNFNLLKNIQYFDYYSKYEFLKLLKDSDFKNLNKISVISKYWTQAQEIVDVGGDFAFFKTHSANLKINMNEYTNTKTSRGFIYMIRDPRDVAISWAKHQGFSINKTIDIMTNQQAISRTTNSSNGLPMSLLRWDQNYLSWKKLKIPNLFIKYENLIDDSENIIRKINLFFENELNLKINNFEVKLKNLLITTNFSYLKTLELESGFLESKNSKFFRKGKINQWKKILSKDQVKRINKEFESTMVELKYL